MDGRGRRLSGVLFLSASVGVGHTAAAEAMRTVLRERGIEARIEDSYRYAASYFAKVVSDGYIGMVKTVPKMYGFLYARAERATGVRGFRRYASRLAANNLRALIARRRPDVVVCTHAFPCGVMAEYKRTIDPSLPVVGVVTDFVVHPYWIHDEIDAYAVATPEMRETLIARGIAPERIAVTGIPVDPRFDRETRSREAIRAKLGLPADRQIVLVMGGGLGIGPLPAMLEALADVRAPIAAVAIAGRNARQERRLRDVAERLPYPARVLGFVDGIDTYMHASDVLLTKPGGLTTSEALVARVPMVFVSPLPGQEERNTRYLTERDAALRASSPEAIVSAVESLLPGSAVRANVLAAVERLRRPDSASQIAATIAAFTRPLASEAS